MSEFYTNVHQWGNTILYRGYKDGLRVSERVKFKPTLYLPAEGETKSRWTTIHGKSVVPRVYDSMKEAREILKLAEECSGIEVYGNGRFTAQFLQHKFPGEIEWDRSLIAVTTLDIEVHSGNGFPKPEDALEEVLCIGLKNSTGDEAFHLFCTKPYDTEQKPVKAHVEVHQYVDELSMLKGFLTWWSTPQNTPDIVTGWNSRMFDMVYLVNRICRLLGEDSAKLLSPWGKIDRKQINYKGRESVYFELAGITQLDYLDIFQKFTVLTYGNQESYKLGNIAHVVLGDDKLHFEGTLADLYENDPQQYFSYNLKDIELVDRFEDKLGLITLAATMAYMAGVNYMDTLGTTAIWDSLIFRDLARRYVTVTPTSPGAIGDYAGGYVKEVMVGKHDWVVSFDVASMYPNLIVQYNMSPETIVEGVRTQMNPEILLQHKEFTPASGEAMAANGVHFHTDKSGVIPRMVAGIIEQRKVAKKLMLEAKKKLQLIEAEFSRRQS